MSNMTFTSPRATFDELMAFANAVREAGGGNPLDALMPAVPQDSSQCLIARNLNFNCEVDEMDEGAWWSMSVEDEELAQKIATALGLDMDGDAIILPPEIGQVAADFDTSTDAISAVFGSHWVIDPGASEDEIQRLQEFWPYIDASVTEAYENASFINEDGELVL